MKAAVRFVYGPPEVLHIEEVPRPIPKPNEVLVKVHAATVNRTDCANLMAKPFIMRFVIGFFKPSLPITGTDFSGVIEEVGEQVTQFNLGDKVWGFKDGGLSSHAEFLTLPEDSAMVTIPVGISFEQAAASAEGAHYAYNIINKVKLTAGQKAIVNGATGAIGSALVQLLKVNQIEVTGVCEGEHMDLVHSLGANKVIDYQSQDFTKDTEIYDYVFDAVGKNTFGKCKPLLKDKGIYISSELGPYFQNLFFALVTPLLGAKKVIFPIPLHPKESLVLMRGLLEEEKFKPVIDRSYPLEEIVDAYRYVMTGRKIGNVLIQLV
ncbi:MAG: NAD(P)-dependent alcohol dehydrogenase [Cyclobacteriaceae bacterium]